MLKALTRRIIQSRIIYLAFPLLLAPTLFLPLGNDQSTFARGGEFLFNGGILYRDYIDQKPPLIFVFYGIAQALFGRSDVGIRLFDIIWQTGTMASIAYVARKLTGSGSRALAAAAIYGILYSSMGFSETLQCETIIAPALVWILYLSARVGKRDVASILLSGALAGLCFASKFPLGVVFLILILWEVSIQKSIADKARGAGILSAGFIAGAAVGLAPLLNPETAQGYLSVLEYTREYVNMIPINMELLQDAFKVPAQFLGDNISLTLVAAAFTGIISNICAEDRDRNAADNLLLLSSFMMMALFASVIAERRFLPYHFTRVYVPFIIVASYGLNSIAASFRGKYSRLSSRRKLLTAALCFTCLIFSPLPRVAKNCRLSFLTVVNPDAAIKTLQHDSEPFLIAADVRNTANYIRSKGHEGATFVISILGSSIYRALDEHPMSKFTMSVYFYSRVISEGAREQMLGEAMKARWIVIQNNDIATTLYGHDKSSWSCVKADSVLYPFLTENFTRAAKFGALYVYERKAVGQ